MPGIPADDSRISTSTMVDRIFPLKITLGRPIPMIRPPIPGRGSPRPLYRESRTSRCYDKSRHNLPPGEGTCMVHFCLVMNKKTPTTREETSQNSMWATALEALQAHTSQCFVLARYHKLAAPIKCQLNRFPQP
ncbi:hypothetical protein EVAR_72835_1 [Eumeta japonica]|uniref:Uncharacterized protein n=1 Tax=Eumeta variegata TaxID=151549 RepID=A0A4C1TTE8_EUMVA|nr:hypothetical protein EVAR_72835_1 [Eumeta japonica]